MTHARSRRHPEGVAGGADHARVAIYTRQSVERDANGEFGSIEAQRAAAEAYIDARHDRGWVALAERYDDRGISGGTIERPALKRLLADVAAGKVDVIACYKFDRLSRSLLDFSQLLRDFESHEVAFVSTTQDFDTSTATGRLLVNMLASFAEFEREMIRERTRDKIQATRRRGMWTGGRPVLGYDSRSGKLVVNEAEAERVRTIFDLYIAIQSVTAVLTELRRRDWTNKAWKNSDGGRSGGAPFDDMSLRRLLANPLYAGTIRCGKDVVEATHEAIVAEPVFAAVQDRLGANRTAPQCPGREWTPLLGSLVACARCGRTMGHVTSARGATRYRYYVCQKAQKEGAKACPGSRAPAQQLEDVVVSKIRAIGRDAKLLDATTEVARNAGSDLRPGVDERLRSLDADRDRILDQRVRLREVIERNGTGSVFAAKLEKLDAALARVDHDRAAASADLAAINTGSLDPLDLRTAVASFDPVWDELFPAERARIVQLLIARVVVDGDQGEIRMEFQSNGIRALIRAPQEDTA